MKKTYRSTAGIIAMVLLAVGVPVHATTLTLSFAAGGNLASEDVNGNSNPLAADATVVYDDFDIFGDGTLTFDLIISPGSGEALEPQNVGWGIDGGSEGDRVGPGESISFAFSDLQGTAASGVTGLELTAVLFRVETNTTATFLLGNGEVLDINGVKLTGNATAPTPSTLQAQGDLASAVTIGTSGSFVIAPDAGSNGVRIGGLVVETIVPEPVSIILLSIGIVGLISSATRRRQTA